MSQIYFGNIPVIPDPAYIVPLNIYADYIEPDIEVDYIELNIEVDS